MKKKFEKEKQNAIIKENGFEKEDLMILKVLKKYGYEVSRKLPLNE